MTIVILSLLSWLVLMFLSVGHVVGAALCIAVAVLVVRAEQ